MSENSCHVNAPPEVVFGVLRDPAAYTLWVVGTKHVRGVDASWPEAGSKLHHTVGWGPIEEHDATEVLEIDPPRRLRLEARLWPLGTAEVDLLLRPSGHGTDLRIVETPLHGPAKRFDNRLMQYAVHVRNAWGLRRLCRWAEERHRGTPGHVPERQA